MLRENKRVRERPYFRGARKFGERNIRGAKINGIKLTLEVGGK